MHFLARFAALGAALVVLAVSGCGQRGPLFLTDNPPPGYKPPKTETYKPVPYPRAADGEAAR
jgi:predicted small lipoprotein YifL